MENLNLEIITKNIFKLLDYSGISDISFSQLLDISEKQLRLIKTFKAEFNIRNINKACDFFGVSLNKINSSVMVLENNFRDTLALKHRNNRQYISLLETGPSIRHAIRFMLVQDEDFKNTGLTVSEIAQKFIKQGWKYTSRYISTSMSRNNDLVEIKCKIISRGKEINIYTTKK